MSEIFSKIGGLLSISNIDSQTDPEEIQKLLKGYRVAETNIQEIMKLSKKLQLSSSKFVDKTKNLSENIKNVADQQEETSPVGPCLQRVASILDEFINYKLELSRAVDADFKDPVAYFIKKELKEVEDIKKKFDDFRLKLEAAQKKVTSIQNKEPIDAVKLYNAQIKLFEAEEIYASNLDEYLLKLQDLEANCFLFLKPLISFFILHANYYRESKNKLNSFKSFFDDMINLSNEFANQLITGFDEEENLSSIRAS